MPAKKTPPCLRLGEAIHLGTQRAELVRQGLACKRRLAASGGEIDAREIVDAANAFRYARGLLAGEQLEEWLRHWHVTSAEWRDYVKRLLLRERWAGELGENAERFPVGEAEIAGALWPEAVCSSACACGVPWPSRPAPRCLLTSPVPSGYPLLGGLYPCGASATPVCDLCHISPSRRPPSFRPGAIRRRVSVRDSGPVRISTERLAADRALATVAVVG